MANTAQAKRYAQAVFLIARERRELDRWLEDLRSLSVLEHNDAFFKALETPNLSFDDKSRLLRDRYPALGALAVNLVNLLIERRRAVILPQIFQEYQKLLDGHRGVQRAEVVTAVALTQEDQLDLERRLSEITGRKVVITSKVDASLIGGVVARFDGKLLDGSTKSRLEALKKQIAGTPK